MIVSAMLMLRQTINNIPPSGKRHTARHASILRDIKQVCVHSLPEELYWGPLEVLTYNCRTLSLGFNVAKAPYTPSSCKGAVQRGAGGFDRGLCSISAPRMPGGMYDVDSMAVCCSTLA